MLTFAKEKAGPIQLCLFYLFPSVIIGSQIIPPHGVAGGSWKEDYFGWCIVGME